MNCSVDCEPALLNTTDSPFKIEWALISTKTLQYCRMCCQTVLNHNVHYFVFQQLMMCKNSSSFCSFFLFFSSFTCSFIVPRDYFHSLYFKSNLRAEEVQIAFDPKRLTIVMSQTPCCVLDGLRTSLRAPTVASQWL